MPFDREAAFSCKVTGIRELFQRMEGLPPEIIKKVEFKGMQRVLNILKAAAVENTPIGPKRKQPDGTYYKGGNLRKGWTTRKRKYGRSVVVGKLINNAPHAHLVELGHRMVIPVEDGRRVEGKGRGTDTGRRVPAHPFLRPALDTKREQCIAELMKSVEEALDKIEVRK